MAETIDLMIDDITTTAFVKLPAGAGPFPGVVVTYHRGGMDDFTEWLVDDLAAKGYGAIAPNHYYALPEGSDVEDRKLHLTDEQMARDLEVSAAWLADQDQVDGARLGLLGHCMGGRTTWVGLVSLPGRWKCGCVWYGGGAFNAMGKVAAPAERLCAIDCPVAGYFGNEDGNPSPDDVNKFDDMLTQLGKPHEFHRYDGAGHAFMGFGEKSRHDEAAKDSWAKALEFIGQHLGQ
jgi:carboxymethylenebutenolidase